MIRYKNYLSSLLITFATILLFLYISPISLRLNLSSSHPYRILISYPLNNPQKGEFVSSIHPITGEKVSKIIMGESGDQISVEENKIYINGAFIGLAKSKSRSGLPLLPIKAGKIEEGYFFLYAPHEDSFDSRYSEFGLVHSNALMENLCPLL